MCVSHSTASSVFSQPIFLFTASLGAKEGWPCPYSRDEKTEAERVSTLPTNMMVGGHEPKPGGTEEQEWNQTPAAARPRAGERPGRAGGGCQSLAFALPPSCSGFLSISPPVRSPRPQGFCARCSLLSEDPVLLANLPATFGSQLLGSLIHPTDARGHSHTLYAVPGAGNPTYT